MTDKEDVLYIHTHTQEYYSAIEKKWNLAILQQHEWLRGYYANQSKLEKDSSICNMNNLEILCKLNMSEKENH